MEAKYWIKDWEAFINFDTERRVDADNAVVLPMCDKEKEWILETDLETIREYVQRVLFYHG